MTVFISYARSNASVVREVRAGLEQVGHEAFYDGDIATGQVWWDEILHQIRDSSAFLFVLSPESARSRACRSELSYAGKLGKPILPLKIKQIPDTAVPPMLAEVEILDFVDPGLENYGHLDQVLDELQSRPVTLPDELPTPPPVPIADLSEARARVERERLELEDQEQLATELGHVAENADDRAAAVALLRQLRRRPDIAESAARTVDRLLIRHGGSHLDRQSKARLDKLVRAIARKECVPILGSGMSDWMLGTRRSLAREWANEYGFPMNFTLRDDLPQVAQYVSVLLDSSREVRLLLGEFYRNHLFDHFGDVLGTDEHEPHSADVRDLDGLVVDVWRSRAADVPTDPHTVLARLGCKIYITTEVTSLLSEALVQEGRQPVVDYCRWNPDVIVWPEPDARTAPPDDYEPTVERPLVYHLFGRILAPASLVIAEDEYLDFLAAVAADRELIPDCVRTAIAESSLLILGFGLQDWGIRVLLRSLVSPQIAEHLEAFGHVAAEFDIDDHAESPEDARNYLGRYFGTFRKPKVHIFWSAVEAFCADLAGEMARRTR